MSEKKAADSTTLAVIRDWIKGLFYQKPSSGIPKIDLASAVQTSLGKADSALQSHQSVSSNNNTASYGNTVVVGTVGGTDLKFTMPAAPSVNPEAISNATIDSIFV